MLHNNIYHIKHKYGSEADIPTPMSPGMWSAEALVQGFGGVNTPPSLIPVVMFMNTFV